MVVGEPVLPRFARDKFPQEALPVEAITSRLNPTGLSPFLIRTSRMWYVYLCDRKGQPYTGIISDLQHRMVQHGAKLLYFET